MANRPTDDFDPRNPADGMDGDQHEPIDDSADFGGTHRKARPAEEDFDDADFVEDDMNDVIDDGDPLADLEDEPEDDQADHDADEAPAPAAKSGTGKGALVFYGLIGLVVIVGGFFVYRSLFPAAPAQQVSTAAPVDISSGDLVVSEAAAPTPAPTPASNSNPLPSPAPAAPAATGDNGWQSTLPPETAAAAAPVVAPPAQPAPAAVSAVNAEALAAVNARLTETDSKLAQIAASVQQLAQAQAAQAQAQAGQQQAMTALQQQPAPAASVTGAPPVDLSGLRADIASLKQQQAQLAATPAAAKAAPAPDLSGLRSDIASLQKQLAQVKTQAARTAAAPASSSPRAAAMADLAPAATEGSPKTRAATSSKAAWVLRAATPGMAWVSPGAGSAELRRVVVGDRLDGIGAVTAIRQDNGHWIVEGASGTVR